MVPDPLSRSERKTFLEKIKGHTNLVLELRRLTDWALELRPKLTPFVVQEKELPQQLVVDKERFQAVRNRFRESCSQIGIRTSPYLLEDYCTLASEINSL
ncbi:MAG TPA: hypothetical protein PLF31_02995 [Candidatus Paceibacterota bacterium]|nr:hypothetical protein [Candidatus Paceibacterota bacterium]